MRLQALRIRDFLSVQDQTVRFDGEGLTLVAGENGVGKSALFVEPLLWLFYDTLNRGDGEKRLTREVKRLDSLRRPVEGETTVEAWFERGGQSWYVKRSLEDGWELSSDGVNVTPYKKKEDGLARAGDAIGLPLRLFRAICVMGQGFPVRFSGFKDTERTTIIEDFIGAQVYEEAKENADREHRAALAASKEVEATRSSLVALIESASRNQAYFAGEITRLRAEESEAETRRRTELANVTASRAQLIEQKVGADTYVAELDGKIASLETTVANHEAESIRIHEILGAIRGAGEANSRRSQEIEESFARGTCGLCCQHVTHATPETAAYVATLRQQITTDSQRAAEFGNSLRTLQQTIAAAKADLTTTRSTRDQYAMFSVRLAAQVGEADNRIAALAVAVVPGQNQTLASYEREYARLDTEIASKRAELAALDASIAKLGATLPEAELWAEHYGIGGIRNWRLSGVLDRMNDRLIGYCDRLFAGQFRTWLSPVKQTKTAGVKPLVTFVVDGPSGCYGLASGGQGRLIDLALHFSLRRLAADSSHGWASNFLVGDEIFDHLDRKIVPRAVEVFREEAERTFLIAHSADLRALCNQVIEVSYVDGVTRL